MENCCLSTACLECCRETNMILTNKDVRRIHQLGFDEGVFSRKQDGWLRLTNHQGKCVFHNGARCVIYEQRPEGCRLYPIVFDKGERCAILDEGCPHRDLFFLSEDAVQNLTNLVSELEEERVVRKKHK